MAFLGVEESLRSADYYRFFQPVQLQKIKQKISVTNDALPAFVVINPWFYPRKNL